MDAAAGGGLQRSEISFRRTGSSGLVWDDKFLGELAKIKPASQDPTISADPAPSLLQRSKSSHAAAEKQQAGYKTMKVPSPSIDPPSPKLSGCGALCSVFSDTKQKQRSKVVGKRRV